MNYLFKNKEIFMKAFGKFKLGNGLKFDGVDDYAKCTTMTGLPTTVATVAHTTFFAFRLKNLGTSDFWFKTEAASSVTNYDLYFGVGSFIIRPSNNQILSILGFNKVPKIENRISATVGNLRDDKIHIVALRQDANNYPNWALFLDGVKLLSTFPNQNLDDTVMNPGSLGWPRLDVAIQATISYEVFFEGTAMLYTCVNKLMTDTEIIDAMKNLSLLKNENRIFDYDFNQNRGNLLIDTSGNNKNATIYGIGTATDYGGYDGNSGWVNALSGKRAL